MRLIRPQETRSNPRPQSPDPGTNGGPVRQPEVRRGGRQAERIGVLEAMRWHWLSVLIPVLVFTGAGVAMGLLREPTYEASTRHVVSLRATSPSALPGAVSAAMALATSYSRAIDATEVEQEIARRAEISEAEVTDRVAAAPVPETALVRVTATGLSSQESADLANIAGNELRQYVERLDETRGAARQLEKYREASRTYEELSDRSEDLQRTFEDSPSTRSEAAHRQAQIDAQVALLRRDAVAEKYRSEREVYTAPLELQSRASEGTSDRISKLQLWTVLGLAAGLAAGAALATFRANQTMFI